MQQTYKDETRWLARMLAIIFFLLALRSVVVQCQRIYVNHDWVPFIFLGIGISFFWFGYQLWRSTSLWNIFLWFSESSKVVLYLQSQYYRINKHIRSGLVGGMILLLIFFPLPLMFSRYKGVWFWESIKQVTYIILLPLKTFLKILSNPLSSYFIPAYAIIYIFAIGFFVGLFISCVKGQTRGNQNTMDMNNGGLGLKKEKPED